MKRWRNLFLWSWIVTLPIALLGSYWAYNTANRFYTYAVRYDPAPNRTMNLYATGAYEFDTIIQRSRLLLKPQANESELPAIKIFVPETNMSLLESRMPQSGFGFVKARLLKDGRLLKAQLRYRGDFIYHWGYYKKSIRIKTKKKKLFDGMRVFNLIAPKTTQQLNNFLSYQLADRLGLFAPRSQLSRVFLNGEYRGVYLTSLPTTRDFPDSLSRDTLSKVAPPL